MKGILSKTRRNVFIIKERCAIKAIMTPVMFGPWSAIMIQSIYIFMLIMSVRGLVVIENKEMDTLLRTLENEDANITSDIELDINVVNKTDQHETDQHVTKPKFDLSRKKSDNDIMDGTVSRPSLSRQIFYDYQMKNLDVLYKRRSRSIIQAVLKSYCNSSGKRGINTSGSKDGNFNIGLLPQKRWRPPLRRFRFSKPKGYVRFNNVKYYIDPMYYFIGIG